MIKKVGKLKKNSLSPKEKKEKKVIWQELNEKQKGHCYYCGLPGDVRVNYSKQLKKIGMWNEKSFRKGRRGKSLELDRKEPNGPYGPDNCVLACYPCNNAKSDVFSHDEFEIIGAVIGGLKEKDGCKKLKKNKYIQGLINAVTKQRQ